MGPKNVVIVTFDTTRADAIGCYGNAEASTPHLDQLAAHGVRFENAFSAVPITLPSHTTLMTGLYPLAHGVRDNGLFVVRDEVKTLAEILHDHGYKTGAAVGSFPLGAQFNLNQGFDFYDDGFTAQYEDFRGRRVLPRTGIFFDERKATAVNRAALPWLEENSDGPFFLWLHYFDPHQPLKPPAPYDQLFLADPYLGEIAFADEAFGEVMDRLEQLGVAEDTLVIMAADHGEGRGEHGEETHSFLTYNTTLHVPLIISVPGGRQGLEISERVGLVDVVPTILELLGIEAAVPFQGRSLAPELEGRTGESRPLYAETLSPRLGHGLGELRVLFDGPFKYIHGPRPELFDLTTDPHEFHNLVESRPDTVASMRRRLEKFISDHAAAETQQVGSVDQETRRRLEALGYLGNAAGMEGPIEETLCSEGIAPQDRVGNVNLMSRAKQLLFDKRFVAARDAAAELFRRQPGDPMALEMLASASLQMGRIDEALGYVNQLRKLYPDGTESSARLMLQLGTLNLYRGEFETAIELLDNADALDPSAEGRYLISLTHLLMGDRVAEKASLESALKLDPTYGPARVALAVHLAREGRTEAARREFLRAIADQPYFARAHFNYGAFLVEQGSLEEARDRFERALQLEPDYPKALLAMVAVSADLGRADEARRWYGILVEKAPDSPERDAARNIVEEK